MKIVRSILLTLLGIVALILIVSIFLPGEVKIISETEINVPLNKVYFSLVTFSDRGEWDPWVSEDTTVKIDISLVEGFVGSKYSWTSKNSGAGSMVIDSAVPNQYISYTLSFEGMSQRPNVWNQFTIKEGKTNLSWGFYQKASYPVGRIFMLVMKGKLQSDYDRGLANLKRLLEEKGVVTSSLSEILIEEIPSFYAMVIEGRGTANEISDIMAESFRKVALSIEQQGLEIVGVPFHCYLNYNKETGISSFSNGFPVNKPGKSTKEVRAIKVPGFHALEAIHTGPYDEFGVSYAKFMKYISEQEINVSKNAWEFYLTGSETVPDKTKWKTLIAFPLLK